MRACLKGRERRKVNKFSDAERRLRDRWTGSSFLHFSYPLCTFHSIVSFREGHPSRVFLTRADDPPRAWRREERSGSRRRSPPTLKLGLLHIATAATYASVCVLADNSALASLLGLRKILRL